MEVSPLSYFMFASVCGTPPMPSQPVVNFLLNQLLGACVLGTLHTGQSLGVSFLIFLLSLSSLS